jgi:hypothetical protein
MGMIKTKFEGVGGITNKIDIFITYTCTPCLVERQYPSSKEEE